MASINEILGKQINSVKELKDEIKNLQNSLIGVDTTSEQYKTTAAQLAAAQDELTKVTKAGKEENLAAKDSIIGMQQEYKKLYEQYRLLNEEQRNSDFGKNMAASLETLSSKLNETKQGVGNFKDNIGRYTQSVTEAFNNMGVSVGALQGPLKTATTGFKGLNTVMKANPIGLVVAALTALVAIFMKVKDAIGQNEELQMRYNEAMAKFKPIADAVGNALEWLADKLVTFVEWIGKATQRIREFGAGVTDFLGITNGAKKALQEQQKIYDDIAKSQNALTKAKREAQKLNADDKARVEALREEASETQNLEEKRRLLNEAKEIQAEIDQRNIEIAQEELRILEEQASLTANDAAMNDRLAAATARVSEAQAQAASNARMFNKQLNAGTTTTAKATTAMKDYREEAKKLYDELIENSKDEITKLTEKYEKEKKLLEKYHYDTTLLTRKYNDDIAKIQKEASDKQEGERLVKLRDTYNSMMEYVKLLNDDLEKNETENAILNGKIKILEGLRRIMDEANGEYEKVKKNIQEVNAMYGLEIKIYQDLENAISETTNRMKELAQERKEIFDKRAQERISAELGIFNSMSMNEELTMMMGGFSPADIAIEKARNTAEALTLEKQLLQEELAVWEGTTDKEIELTQRLYEVQEELLNRQMDLQDLNEQRTTEMIYNITDSIANLSSALGTIRSSYETLVDSELKAGKIDEQQAKEKKKRLLNLEKVQTAFAITSIAADAAAGLFTIWKGYATETGVVNPQTAAATGPAAAVTLAALNTKSLVSAIAKSASLAATASAQIMAARNGYVADVNNFSADSGNGSSGVGVGASPVLIDSTPYTYSRTVQSQDEIDEINNRPVWVSVTDIESGLNHRVQVTGESSF